MTKSVSGTFTMSVVAVVNPASTAVFATTALSVMRNESPTSPSNDEHISPCSLVIGELERAAIEIALIVLCDGIPVSKQFVALQIAYGPSSNGLPITLSGFDGSA